MPAIRKLNHEDREFMASLGIIPRPCSDYTTTHRNLKTEKSIYFIMLKKLFFFPFQDKMNVLASKFQAGHVSLGRLYFGHKAQNKFFILFLNLSLKADILNPPNPSKL